MELIEYFFFSPRPPMGYILGIIVTTVPYVFLSLVIYAIVRSYLIHVRKKNVSIKRELLYAFAVAYVTLVVKLSIIPDWSFYHDLETQEVKFSSGLGCYLPVNLIPLRSILSFLCGDVHVNEEDAFMIIALNLASGILLLAPMGFLLPILLPQANNWKIILFIGIGCSLAIEIIQFFIGRVADIDDIILNLVGVLAGYGCYCAIFKKDELPRSS